MIEIIGWIGAAAFCLCGIPQAIRSVKEGHSDGVSHGLLWMWMLGEICMPIYIYAEHGFDLPVHFNYFMNFCCLVVITKYKYWRKV